MAHWENRPEEGWQKFQFNQPYEKGLFRNSRGGHKI